MMHGYRVRAKVIRVLVCYITYLRLSSSEIYQMLMATDHGGHLFEGGKMDGD